MHTIERVGESLKITRTETQTHEEFVTIATLLERKENLLKVLAVYTDEVTNQVASIDEILEQAKEAPDALLATGVLEVAKLHGR